MTTYKRPSDAYDLMRRLDGVSLSLAERAVLLAHYKFADKDGTNVFASEETIGEYLNCTSRTVRTHRKTLRVKGWLVEKRRGRNTGGKPTSSVYEVVIPAAAPVPVEKPKRTPNPTGRNQHTRDSTGKILPLAQGEGLTGKPSSQEEDFNHLPKIPKIDVEPPSVQPGPAAPHGAQQDSEMVCCECSQVIGTGSAEKGVNRHGVVIYRHSGGLCPSISGEPTSEAEIVNDSAAASVGSAL